MNLDIIIHIAMKPNALPVFVLNRIKVVKQNGKYYHDSLTDSEVILLKSSQDLKKEVTGDITK
ncbi:hypothetical protein BpHYR1_005033 [Brachionus plicatilis]|uniref:Uncharacterized protein n=1 Tax=Brachionus plicatilis TaxID=10195 RepID=A0A3M7QUG1_BRAPC|nr:hypothetical protein BpHYR1_005033 [Brachionus plicatilis]